MSTPEAHFRATAPVYMRRLLTDFPELNQLDAAAIFGNMGHESLGFTVLQEIKPTVAGSKGGWGWAQWTGPRRRAFDAYVKRTGKDPAANDTNYAYLFLELNGSEGTEGGALAKVRAAQGLDEKVEAFEKAFLRAGVKHYPSRKKWAQIALEAFRSYTETEAAPVPRPRPTIHPIEDHEEPIAPPPAKRRINWLVVAGVLIALVLAFIAFVPLPA